MSISLRRTAVAAGLMLMTAVGADAASAVTRSAETGGAAFPGAGQAFIASEPRAPRTLQVAPKTRALLERIAKCESGGDPTAISPGGQYRGKYQFAVPTWRAVGGTGDPAAAPEAEQDRRAAKLLRVQGRSAWPVCAA